MKNFNEISAFVFANIQRNAFGVTLVTETEPKMNKRGNPFYGRVVKRTRSVNVALGRDYEKRVNKDLADKGLAPTFKSAKPSGRHIYDKTMFFEQSDTDADKFYLRVMYNRNSKSYVTYLIDGRDATPQELKELEEWLPKSAPSAKQSACGLDEGEQEIFRAYLTTSIVEIAQGSKVLK